MFRGVRAGLTSLRAISSCTVYLEARGVSPGAAPVFARPAPHAQPAVLGLERAPLQSRSFSSAPLQQVRSWLFDTRRVHTVQSKQQTTQPQPFAATVAQTQDKVQAKAHLIFDTCWRRLESKLQGKLQLPKEIVWLNGAPGSGKGVNTPFILESRGLSRAVSMSSLFQQNEDIRQLMDRGELVPDSMVGDALLDTIFEPDADAAGLVIDGFPRTALQVEVLKLLYDKMMALHVQHADTPDEFRFPRPSFKIVVLYVEADESIKRQLLRARQASLHNRRVLDAGAGSLQDVRPTDEDIVKCRRRYEVFKAHYGTLLRLKQYFPFSLIDAMGSVEECRQQIAREMRYQSSMDLAEATYSAIRHLPLAKELVRTSRQQLVSHLDMYCKKHNHVFLQVIKVIDDEAIPVLKRCSLAGHAELKTHNQLFSEAPIAADMFMDILTDRGFSTAYFMDEQVVPYKIDLTTGEILNRYEYLHHFRITFESAKVRAQAAPPPVSGAPALASEARASESLKGGLGIGCSSVPVHLDHQRPRPDFAQQVLTDIDLGGKEPVMATPDPKLDQ